MDCAAARHLIDQGIVPGPRTPVSTQLGFHLVQCAACRTYRERQASLLHALLLDQSSVPETTASVAVVAPTRQVVEPTYAPPEPMAEPPRAGHRWGGWSRAARLVGTGALVCVMATLLWVGGILVRAQQNIASFVVTTVPYTAQPLARAAAGGVGAGLSGPLIDVPPLDAPQRAPSPSSSAAPTASTTPLAGSQIIAQTSPTAHSTTRMIITATSWSTGEPVPTVPAATSTSEPQAPPPGEPFTVLILGNDRRPGEAGIPRTDVIMLARIDPQRGRIALLSFPRDLWVAIPAYGQARLNAAYVWGEVYHAQGGGLALAKATVSNLIGRPIDYVLMVDFQGFIGLIDSLGGVTVEVEKALDDPQFPTMDYGYTHATFEPGAQHMDGALALTYSRIRHPDSDFARITRQQAVLVGIGARIQERGDLQNLLAADTITAALRGYVQTDIPQDRILGALWALRHLHSTTVERYTLDQDHVAFGVGDDHYAELPVAGAIEELTHRLYGE